MKFFHSFYKIIFIFFSIVFLSSHIFADDIYPLEDNFDISEILNDIETIETDSQISQLPTINSRAYVVIDRKSNTVLIGKNENQKNGFHNKNNDSSYCYRKCQFIRYS